MKVIVCGAGQVGTAIARQLAMEDNDVSVIDQSEELIQRIGDTLDVRARVGNASHPPLLKELGAEEAQMIIAVTMSDEVNMVACQIAHSLFDIPVKIARIRHSNYLMPQWSHLYRHDHLPIDYIISPEAEVAKAVIHRLHVPGAVDTIPFANGLLKIVGMRCTLDCPLINMNLSKIRSKLSEFSVSILGVMREDNFIIANDHIDLLIDDELYFAVDSNHVRQVMSILGHEEGKAHRIVIVGGGNIGLHLAQSLENDEKEMKIKLIEVDKNRAEFVADRLSHSTVINGDALSQEILNEVNVANTETLIAVSNDDEVNILSSLLSKRLGCQRVVSLVTNAASYSPLMASLGIDVVVNPREITVSTILQHVRKGQIISARSICKGKAEIIEAEVIEQSSVVGKHLEEIGLPDEIIIGAIVRNNEVLLPDGDLVLEKADRIVMLTQARGVKQLERIFSVKFEFF